MRKLNVMLFVLVLVLVFSGCGGESTSTEPTSLHVIRPVDLNHFFTRLDRTITDKKAIQYVYTAALALPSFPIHQGAISCGADFGIVYQLIFLGRATSLHTINIEATGCSKVQIDNASFRRMNGPFEALVAKTLDIPSLLPSDTCLFQHNKCDATS